MYDLQQWGCASQCNYSHSQEQEQINHGMMEGENRVNDRRNQSHSTSSATRSRTHNRTHINNNNIIMKWSFLFLIFGCYSIGMSSAIHRPGDQKSFVSPKRPMLDDLKQQQYHRMNRKTAIFGSRTTTNKKTTKRKHPKRFSTSDSDGGISPAVAPTKGGTHPPAGTGPSKGPPAPTKGLTHPPTASAPSVSPPAPSPTIETNDDNIFVTDPPTPSPTVSTDDSVGEGDDYIRDDDEYIRDDDDGDGDNTPTPNPTSIPSASPDGGIGGGDDGLQDDDFEEDDDDSDGTAPPTPSPTLAPVTASPTSVPTATPTTVAPTPSPVPGVTASPSNYDDDGTDDFFDDEDDGLDDDLKRTDDSVPSDPPSLADTTAPSVQVSSAPSSVEDTDDEDNKDPDDDEDSKDPDDDDEVPISLSTTVSIELRNVPNTDIDREDTEILQMILDEWLQSLFDHNRHRIENIRTSIQKHILVKPHSSSRRKNRRLRVDSNREAQPQTEGLNGGRDLGEYGIEYRFSSTLYVEILATGNFYRHSLARMAGDDMNFDFKVRKYFYNEAPNRLLVRDVRSWGPTSYFGAVSEVNLIEGDILEYLDQKKEEKKNEERRDYANDILFPLGSIVAIVGVFAIALCAFDARRSFTGKSKCQRIMGIEWLKSKCQRSRKKVVSAPDDTLSPLQHVPVNQQRIPDGNMSQNVSQHGGRNMNASQHGGHSIITHDRESRRPWPSPFSVLGSATFNGNGTQAPNPNESVALETIVGRSSIGFSLDDGLNSLPSVDPELEEARREVAELEDQALRNMNLFERSVVEIGVTSQASITSGLTDQVSRLALHKTNANPTTTTTDSGSGSRSQRRYSMPVQSRPVLDLLDGKFDYSNVQHRRQSLLDESINLETQDDVSSCLSGTVPEVL